MDKKCIAAMAKEYGCKAKYSGKTRTMYIHGTNKKAAVLAIKNYYYTSYDVVEGSSS